MLRQLHAVPASQYMLQWPAAPPCRLSFDARGEADLRRPITSSLAIVQLQQSRQQQQQVQQQANPASTSAAAAATTAATAVAAAAPGGGVSVLDWSRKLAVFAPDDCQLICDTPGHFKVGGYYLLSTYVYVFESQRINTQATVLPALRSSSTELRLHGDSYPMVGGGQSRTGSYAAWFPRLWVDAGKMMKLCCCSV
jgi:hypothetical protein